MIIYITILVINIILLFIPVKKIYFFYANNNIDTSKIGKFIIRKPLFLHAISNVDTSKICLSIVCIILFILMSFRDYNVGIDTDAYQRSYIRIANSNSFSEAIKISTFSGPGYILICWLIHYISDSPRICIIIFSIIINLLLYKFANKSKTRLKYILLWQTSNLFTFSLNGNRQVLSTLLQINGLDYILQNSKKLRGWIYIILAISIHPVSIIIPIAYYISKIIVLKRSFQQTIILGILSGFTVNFLLGFIVNFFTKLFPSYIKYFNNNIERSFYNSIGGGKIVFFYIFLLLIMLYYGLFHKEIKGMYYEEKIILYMSLSFCVLGILNSRNTTISRIFNLILPYSIYIVSRLNIGSKIENNKILEIIIHIVFIIYLLLNLIDNQNGVNPYIFSYV